MYFPLSPGTSVSPSQGRQAGQGTDPEGDTMSRVMWEEEDDDCVTLLVKYSRSDECLLERSVEEEEEICVSKSLEAVQGEEDLETLASGIVNNVIVNLSHENRCETEIHSGVFMGSPLKEEDVQEMVEKSGKGYMVEVDVLVREFVTSVIHKAWQEHIEETRDKSTCQTAYTLVPELNSEETAGPSEEFNQGIQDFITFVISTACQELEKEEEEEEEESLREVEDEMESLREVEDEMESLREVEDEMESLREVEDEMESLREVEVEMEYLREVEVEMESLREVEDQMESLREVEDQMESLRDVKDEMESLREVEDELETLRDHTHYLERASRDNFSNTISTASPDDEDFDMQVKDLVASVISAACNKLEEEGDDFPTGDITSISGDDLDGFVEYLISLALEEGGDNRSFVEEETRYDGSKEVNRNTSKLWSSTGEISESLYEDSDFEDDEPVADRERKKVNTLLVKADVHPVPTHLRDEDVDADDNISSCSSELSTLVGLSPVRVSDPCISPLTARVQTISTSTPEVSIISQDLSKAAHLRGVKRGVSTGDLPGNEHLSVPVRKRRTVGDRARALFRRISRPFRRRNRQRSERNRRADGEHGALRMSGGGQRAEVSSTDPGGSGSKYGKEKDKAPTTKIVIPRGPSVALLDEDEITIDVTCSCKPAEPSRADRILKAISRPFTVCVSSS